MMSNSGRVIDLQGPQGNAFALMGIADDWLRQMGRRDDFRFMRESMMAGDYNNLLRVFEQAFGDYMTFANAPEDYVYGPPVGMLSNERREV